MAGVSVPGGGGGRRSVDSNVNMVPMIDLLISVIAFLLMTSVWVQTGAVQARMPSNQQAPSISPPNFEPLRVLVRAGEVRVATTAGDERVVPNTPDARDRLREVLQSRHALDPSQREVWVQPEGGISYGRVVEVMDVVYEVWGQNRPRGTTLAQTVNVQVM